jgi:hypothetical protein
MPHKYNADRRHHIPRPKRRVTNWSEYSEALRQRGSLTVWFTEDAIAAWKAAPRTTLGGQPHYSDLAITTALTLRAVFHLALRQTEGLIGSILQLLVLDLPVPDFSTLNQRARNLELPAQPRTTTLLCHMKKLCCSWWNLHGFSNFNQLHTRLPFTKAHPGSKALVALLPCRPCTLVPGATWFEL